MESVTRNPIRGYPGALLIGLLLAAASTGCAKQGMPPGGPVDEEAPTLESTFPESGSINVSRGQPIVFRFSEAMNHRSVERALFFTPDIGPTLRVSWRGRELHLDPLAPYRENTTIVVTLGADAADLRNNRLGRSTTVAFSTGPAMDDGVVEGGVLDWGLFKPGAWIWIYPLPATPVEGPANDPSPLLPPQEVRPLYITQADDEGMFSQSFIGRGIYRVFAFDDRDGNRRYDRESDPLAVPPTSVGFGDVGERVEGLMLHLAMRDTTGPMLRSASAPNSDFVHVRFSEPTAPGRLPVVALQSYVEEAEEPPGRWEGSILRSYSPIESPTTLVLQVDRLQPGARYRVRLVEARDEQGNPGREGTRPVTFSCPAQADTTRPAFDTITPPDSSRTLNEDTVITLAFSTEIDATLHPPWLLTGPDTVGLGAEWLDPRTLELRPQGPVVADAFYDLHFPAGSLRSWTGLDGPAEEVLLTWQGIRPAGRGTLRFRVESDALPAGGLIRVYVNGVGSGSTPVLRIDLTSPGEVITTELIEGPYMVWGFTDADGDGILNTGSATPYIPAEVVAALTDTLYVIDSFESVYETPLVLRPAILNREGAGPPP